MPGNSDQAGVAIDAGALSAPARLSSESGANGEMIQEAFKGIDAEPFKLGEATVQQLCGDFSITPVLATTENRERAVVIYDTS